MSLSKQDFSFIASAFERTQIEETYNIINGIENGWNILRERDPSISFMFGPNSAEIEDLMKKIIDQSTISHTGFSFTFVMRTMERIAR